MVLLKMKYVVKVRVTSVMVSLHNTKKNSYSHIPKEGAEANHFHISFNLLILRTTNI